MADGDAVESNVDVHRARPRLGRARHREVPEARIGSRKRLGNEPAARLEREPCWIEAVGESSVVCTELDRSADRPAIVGMGVALGQRHPALLWSGIARD